MKVLVVGGTGFLGGAITKSALNDGHDVHVLTRRQLKSEHPNLTYIVGDRYEGLPVFSNSFDLVFDTCAFEPEAIKNLLDVMDVGALKRYVFISSVSVYEEYLTPRLSENKTLKSASPLDFELVNSLQTSKRTSAYSYGDSYGRLKRECEILIERELGGKAIILRSGLLVGAGDYTDRLTWWVRRIDQTGLAVCPNPKKRDVQLIDVRDAAEFALKTAKDGKSGVFNLTGHKVTFGDLIKTIKDCADSKIDLKWVDLCFFTNQNLEPWSDIPLVIPEIDSLKYFFDIDISKSIEAGLKLRNLDESILGILLWDRENRDRKLKCGYNSETEQAVALDQDKLGK